MITDIKYGLPFKILVLISRTQQHNGCTKTLGDTKFLPVITWNRKHSLKQVVSITCTLVKDFFCETFLFRQSKKACSIIWSTWVFFAFLEKRRPNKYCSWKVNLVFHIKRFSSQSVNLFWVLVVFPPIFVVNTKIIYSYDFVAPLMMIMIFSFFVYLIHFFLFFILLLCIDATQCFLCL